MKIRLLEEVAGLPVGSVRDVPDETAKYQIEQGKAEAVKDDPQPTLKQKVVKPKLSKK